MKVLVETSFNNIEEVTVVDFIIEYERPLTYLFEEHDSNLSQFGGKTKLILSYDNRILVATARCRPEERFCRKKGIITALSKFINKVYGLEFNIIDIIDNSGQPILVIDKGEQELWWLNQNLRSLKFS